MKARYFLPLGLPLLLLAGCTVNTAPTNPVQGIAASIITGQAFDRSMLAIQRGDDAGLMEAGKELQRGTKSDSNSRISIAFTSVLAQKAALLSQLADLSQHEEKESLLVQSDAKYRVALAFAPIKSPEKVLDAQTLNTLGYFLADRGQSRADFEKAAQFTKASYGSWPMSTGVGASDSIAERALAPQDSYAWALFKLGRFEEARIQEEEVLSTVRAIAPSKITPEIPFHMAEIYRAIGEKEKARSEYQQALVLQPNADLKAKIALALESLDFKQV